MLARDESDGLPNGTTAQCLCLSLSLSLLASAAPVIRMGERGSPGFELQLTPAEAAAG